MNARRTADCCAELDRLRACIRLLEQRVANQADTIRHERAEARRWRDAFESSAGAAWQLDLAGFPERLRSLRMAHGWTQGELATRVRMTSAAVSMWEGGRAHPRWPLVPVLTDVLGVTAAELLGGVRR